MTDGAIAQWKKSEGESFAAGDILLEIETDKATIDVEAQEDGIVGKILAADGTKNIPVGKIIALLAEEGDDISNLEAPKEEQPPPQAKSSPQKEDSSETTQPRSPSPPPPSEPTKQTTPPQHNHTPKHPRALFPSVLRLLVENNVADPKKINGTGVRGMLTKGDVLAFLGKASSPTGSFKEKVEPTAAAPKKEEPKILDTGTVRSIIVSSLVQNASRTRTVPPLAPQDFASIIADYLPPTPEVPPKLTPPPPARPTSTGYFDGLL
ncbi:single hybrid motif-containing protein [Rickenella mellea]|uniref:Single hybrid motif-containing protein n=1 Tax=Rickenella mellea TaxID=50990 RepID=A0A4Y7QKQ4_9AGAM|nr:single hybrid motif-containing protein [Rickenella mellea]